MKVESSFVFLKNVRFYAFHGVMAQERQVGGEFLLSLKVGYPLDKAMESDDVKDTLNYATLFELANGRWTSRHSCWNMWQDVS